jgi:hypothetical protein
MWSTAWTLTRSLLAYTTVSRPRKKFAHDRSESGQLVVSCSLRLNPAQAIEQSIVPPHFPKDRFDESFRSASAAGPNATRWCVYAVTNSGAGSLSNFSLPAPS